MKNFPKNFLWGAATSAYQVEGDNFNSDWWEWEKANNLKNSSGQACRHYQFFQEDFDFAKSLNHNVHRLSIEWSRVQPEENEFSLQALAHYRQVIFSLKQRGIEPIVTLHHFTNPAWFSRLGGWLNPNAPDYFFGFVGRVIEELCDDVRFWVTINEPMVYVYQSYILGLWPPQEKSFSKARRVENNLALAHIHAYKLIREMYRKKKIPRPFISVASNMQAFQACKPGLRNSLAVYLRNRLFNFAFLERLMRANTLDFVGLNYYTRSLVEVRGWQAKNFLLDICSGNHSNLKKNSIGWDIYPQGLYDTLLALKNYGYPVFILENGICTPDDALRSEFIYQHLNQLHRAMQEGVRVLGYVYWSLIDNYEWDKGFEPRFGLIEVDYNTYQRTIRESAKKFARVCATGDLDTWNG
jgi:beta-glucosidase